MEPSPLATTYFADAVSDSGAVGSAEKRDDGDEGARARVVRQSRYFEVGDTSPCSGAAGRVVNDLEEKASVDRQYAVSRVCDRRALIIIGVMYAMMGFVMNGRHKPDAA